MTHVVDPGSAASAELSLASLPRGRTPQVPWIEGATVHLLGHDVTVRDVAWDPGLQDVAPFGSGIVTDSYDDKAFEWMGWYDAAGHRLRKSYGDVRMAWSPEHREVAWYDNHHHQAVLASSGTGQVVRRSPAPARLVFPEPAGWLGAGDVLFALNSSADRPRSWRTSSARIEPDPAVVLAATSERGLVAGVSARRPGSRSTCVMVWPADRPRAPLWRDCLLGRDGGLGPVGGGPTSFSPDGSLLAVGAWGGAMADRPMAVVLLEARTGRVVAQLDEGRYLPGAQVPEHEVMRAVFEDDSHLLLTVSDRSHGPGHRAFSALVRCDVTVARCRLATAPRPWSPGGRRPYGLVG